jgi:hypothetical protein
LTLSVHLGTERFDRTSVGQVFRLSRTLFVAEFSRKLLLLSTLFKDCMFGCIFPFVGLVFVMWGLFFHVGTLIKLLSIHVAMHQQSYF